MRPEDPALGAVFEELRRAALDVSRYAYAPYSKLAVGAAARTTDGRIVVGCNVENASYGLTLCAECSMVAALCASGGGRLAQFACRSADGELLMPCGRCRQVLYEFGGPSLLVDSPDGPLPLSAILPYAFGPEDLP